MRGRRRWSRRAEFEGSEAELCALLIERARSEGFRVVPECSGWDVLLVAPETGEQIGVQAKLRPNLDVLAQTVVPPRSRTPDVVAVLVPHVSFQFARVAEAMRVEVFTYGAITSPSGRGPLYVLRNGRRREVITGRCWIPDDGIDVEVPAGVPGPRTVSPWKIGAARLCLRLRAGEQLTRADFAAHGIRVDTWTRCGYVERIGRGRGSVFVMRGPERGGAELPDVRMPEVVDAVRRSLDSAAQRG